MKNLLVLFAIVLLFRWGVSVMGVDVSQSFSTSTYTCMKKEGVRFAIIRAFRSYGAVDPNAVTGLRNAKAAGLITDIYMFPCRAKSANSQVDSMMGAISSSLYGMVWLDVEINPSSGCSWSGHTAASNCDYVEELVSRIRAKGKKVGIYASIYMWETIMGSRTACTKAASNAQLWYAHYDNKASFSDYSKIGGWTKPSIKQYKGDTTLCGAGVDLNYY